MKRIFLAVSFVSASTFAFAQTNRPVSLKLLLPNLLNDQARIWTFPVRLGQTQNLVNTGAFLGTTAGLIALDPHEGSWFRNSSSFEGFNKIFSSNATEISTIVAPVALYGAGLIRKDPKMQETALFAGEALADAEIVTTVFKEVTKRERPASVGPGGNYSDTWREGGSSFPSGHTIAAFSVATVVARRYGNHRWVPWVAYGLATGVGLSRMSLSAHFASDVFVGAALGYTISRFTVLRR